jgi:hypothetical protein
MSSVKTVKITTKELKKDETKKSASNTKTFTSKSNSKFVDYLWSKFTKPKSTNKNKLDNNNNTTENNKKHKRGIFNLFDTSNSKTKGNNSGLKSTSKRICCKNSCSSSGSSNLQDKHVYDNNINTNITDTIESSDESSSITQPYIESFQAHLIDNSMMKSKIQAVGRRNNKRPSYNRNVIPSSKSSTHSLSQSMNKFEEIQDTKEEAKTTDPKEEEEDVTSKVKPLIIKSTSQELFTSSTQFSSSSDPTFEKTEKNRKSTISQLKKSSNTSFSNPNYKSISSIDKNTSNSVESNSIDNSETINSSSSFTTNLCEKSGENVDLFAAYALTSEESSTTEKSEQISDKNHNADDLELSPTEETNSEKKKTKFIIYDNNLTNKTAKNGDETNEKYKILKNKFHTQFSTPLQAKTRSKVENTKSKSCERIATLDNDDSPETKESSGELKGEIELKVESAGASVTKGADKLSYSKSLRILETNSRLFPLKIDSSTHIIEETFNDDKLKNLTDRNEIFTKILKEFTSEPTWKELAFKKQNAWNQKNLEQNLNVSSINK